MKFKLSTNLTGVLVALALLFTACDKSENEDLVPDPANPDPNVACVLTKALEDDADEHRFVYNAKGYIERITYLDKESGDEEYETFEYDANNRLVKSKYYEDSALEQYAEYTYVNGVLNTEKWFSPDGELTDQTVYTFDSNGRVTEILDKAFFEDNKFSTWRSVFTYNSAGNATTRTVYYADELRGEEIGYTETYEGYDDKKRVSLTVAGVLDFSFGSSRNNPSKVITDYGDYGYITEYSYKYNDKGFPTEVTEDYDDEVSKTTYSYSCN